MIRAANGRPCIIIILMYLLQKQGRTNAIRIVSKLYSQAGGIGSAFAKQKRFAKQNADLVIADSDPLASFAYVKFNFAAKLTDETLLRHNI